MKFQRYEKSACTTMYNCIVDNTIKAQYKVLVNFEMIEWEEV